MPTRIDIAPGAVHIKAWLSRDAQRALADECFALGGGDAGFYTPIVRGGKPMSVRMLCVGRHWNARAYRYEDTRTDVDARLVPTLPERFRQLAVAAAREAGFDLAPDVAIINWYSTASRMGLHQDKHEPASLASGAPVVSFS